jgi:hypothetical protein
MHHKRIHKKTRKNIKHKKPLFGGGKPSSPKQPKQPKLTKKQKQEQLHSTIKEHMDAIHNKFGTNLNLTHSHLAEDGNFKHLQSAYIEAKNLNLGNKIPLKTLESLSARLNLHTNYHTVPTDKLANFNSPTAKDIIGPQTVLQLPQAQPQQPQQPQQPKSVIISRAIAEKIASDNTSSKMNETETGSITTSKDVLGL